MAMRSSSDWWRLARRTLVINLVVLLGAFIAVRLLAVTPIGHSFAKSRIESATVRGQSFSIEGLRGDLLGRFTIDRLEVSDPDGAWLVAENTNLTWSPLALLGGKLDLESIAVAELKMARRPAIAETTSQQGRSRGWIKAYQARDMSFPSITLAEGIAGQASNYAATGSLAYLGGKGDIALQLRPTSQKGDIANVDLSWGRSSPLEGVADIQGMPGGLVSTVLGTDQGKAVNAEIAARREDGRWIAEAAALVGEAQVVDLTASLADLKLDLQGTIDPAAFVILSSFAQRVGGETAFKASMADVTKASPISVSIVAPNLTASLDGVLDRTSPNQSLTGLNLSVSKLRAAELLGENDIDITDLSATGILVRHEQGLRFTGKVETPRIKLGDRVANQVRASGVFAIEGSLVSADAQLDVEKLTGVPEVLAEAPVLTFQGSYDRDQLRVISDKATLKTETVLLTAAGSAGLNGVTNMRGTFSISAGKQLPEVAATWSLEGRDGAVSGTVAGTAQPQGLPEDVRLLFGEGAAFSANYARTPAGAITLSQASLRGEKIKLTGSGRFADQSLNASADIMLAAIDVRGVEMAPSEATLRVGGPIDQLNGSLVLLTETLKASGQVFTDLEASADFVLSDHLDADLEISSNYRGLPLTVSAASSLQGQTWSLAEIEGRFNEIGIAGRAAGRGADPAALDIALKMVQHSDTGYPFDGTLVYTGQRLDSSVETANLVLGTAIFDSLKVEVSGTWPRFDTQINASGSNEMFGLNVPFKAEQNITADIAAKSAIIDLAARVGEAEIRSETPVNIAYTDGLSADADLFAFGGSVSFRTNLGAADGQASVVFTNIDIAAIGPLLGRPSLQGKMSGEQVYRSVDNRIEGEYSLVLKDLKRGAQTTPSANINLTGELANDIAAFTLVAEDEGGLSLKGEAEIEIETDYAARSVRLSPNSKTRFTATGGGEIAPLWALVASPDTRLEGDVQMDLSGDGPLKKLRPTGPLTFRNGELEDAQSGLMLKDIRVDATVERTGISVSLLEASGGKGGSLSGEGQYAYSGDGNVAVRLDRLNALKRRDVRAIVSGEAQIGRKDSLTEITGDLRLDQANLDISHLQGGGYITLDVDFENGHDDTQTVEETPAAVRLDLRVRGDQKLYISGPGIDTEWSVDARVSGSPSSPFLRGDAEIVRGEVDLVSRRFKIDEGAIQFSGSPRDATMRVRAVRTSNGITASVLAQGPIMDPEITLGSEPSLPEDEVLSRVLFGRSAAQLSPLEAAQLAGAIAALAGNDSFDITAPLQAAIGVDRLNFGVDDTGGAILSAGKYLADDLYLEIETGATGAPGVAIEWTPLSNVELDATIDPELGPRVAIQWKRDFETLPGEQSVISPDQD